MIHTAMNAGQRSGRNEMEAIGYQWPPRRGKEGERSGRGEQAREKAWPHPSLGE